MGITAKQLPVYMTIYFSIFVPIYFLEKLAKSKFCPRFSSRIGPSLQTGSPDPFPEFQNRSGADPGFLESAYDKE